MGARIDEDRLAIELRRENLAVRGDGHVADVMSVLVVRVDDDAGKQLRDLRCPPHAVLSDERGTLLLGTSDELLPRLAQPTCRTGSLALFG